MIKTKKRPAGDIASDSKIPKVIKNDHQEKTKKFSKRTDPKRNKDKHLQSKKFTNISDKEQGSKKPFVAVKVGIQEKFNIKHKQENLKPEDWTEFKKKKKELRIIRKKKKNENLFELCVKAKKIGERLRIKNLQGANTERNKLCEELHRLLKGGTNDKSSYSKLVLAHDMTRVIQVLLKYSNPEIKEEIIQDLLSCVVLMLQSSYGRFCVNKMFKYGSAKMRSSIIDTFYGHAVKLTAHSLSSSVIDTAYVTWASADQKLKLKQEFYGDIYRNNKDESVICLADTYKNSEHMKGAMLSATKANLLKVINKQLLDNALFHTVLHEFLTQCSNDDRTEIVSQLCPSIATLCSTKEGTRSGMICLWQATNKEKKILLRSIKDHIIKLAQHEHGHIILLSILSSVDDTVLLNKMLVNELVFNSGTLIQNEWGRKVVLWLVAPADKAYFHPDLIDEMNEGIKTSNSKKSTEIRAQEILVNCIDPLCDAINQNATEWLKSSAIAMVTIAVLKAGAGESLRNALSSLADVIVSPNWKVANEIPNKGKHNQKFQQKDKVSVELEENFILGIEHAGLHVVLKKLAQFDKTQATKGNSTFGEAVACKLKKKVLKQWLNLNRACFFLLTIIENCENATKETLLELLSSSTCKEILQSQTHTGAKLLLKKIE